MTASSSAPTLHPRTARLCRVMAILGGVILAAGFFLSPDRAWANLLIISFGFVGLGLGGTLFVAMHHLAGAGWATALRRIPEAMFLLLPAGGAGMVCVLLFRPELYPWTNPGPELVHHLAGFKGAWLNRPFFLARAAVYLAVWFVLARVMILDSRSQDHPGASGTARNGRFSALFVAVFAVTFCLASFDWIMSLEPTWYSTIFGLYNFAGLFVATLALMTLQAVWLLRRGDFRNVLREEHLHDLGKLMLGFSTFWAYMWFSQYMLIWYSNIPEETAYYIIRLKGGWSSLLVLNVILNWAIPFFVLLPIKSKRNPGVMVKVAAVLLAGRWLDLYLMVMPPVTKSPELRFGVWEVGALLCAVGIVPLLLAAGLRLAPLVPSRDPRLAQSLHYHT